MTRYQLLSVAVIAGSGMLGACSGGSKPAPPPANAPASGAAAVAAGDFGVPECDEYMRKYLACIDGKVPEMARGMMKQSLDQQKAAWKQAASTPEGRTGLAAGCKAADEQTKAAVVQTYGCAW